MVWVICWNCAWKDKSSFSELYFYLVLNQSIKKIKIKILSNLIDTTAWVVFLVCEDLECEEYLLWIFPFFLPPVNNPVWLIHHTDQQILITRIKWSNWNVSHSSKLATVIQMLILQTKEVPHKPPATHTTNQTTNRYFVGSIYEQF